MSTVDEFLTIEDSLLRTYKDRGRYAKYHLTGLELRRLLERFSRFSEVRS